MASTEHRVEFQRMAANLVNARLQDLFELAEFRALLETTEWSDTMEVCKQAIRRGLGEVPEEAGHQVLNLSTCGICKCLRTSGRGHCTRCGSELITMRKARFIWLD